MQVGNTAGVHLTERARNPERFEALEEILSAVCERGIEHLIIGGDLFNESQRNYAEFEVLCTRPAYDDLQVTVIPGNHDSELRNAHFSADNVRVVEEPALVSFAEGARPFLFVPYRQGQTMGEAVAPFASQLPEDEWVLVGHGNWVSGTQARNPYEPSVYMPLTRSDIQRFRPAARLAWGYGRARRMVGHGGRTAKRTGAT